MKFSLKSLLIAAFLVAFCVAWFVDRHNINQRFETLAVKFEMLELLAKKETNKANERQEKLLAARDEKNELLGEIQRLKKALAECGENH